MVKDADGRKAEFLPSGPWSTISPLATVSYSLALRPDQLPMNSSLQSRKHAQSPEDDLVRVKVNSSVQFDESLNPRVNCIPIRSKYQDLTSKFLAGKIDGDSRDAKSEGRNLVTGKPTSITTQDKVLVDSKKLWPPVQQSPQVSMVELSNALIDSLKRL